jgi:hypothetical protein
MPTPKVRSKTFVIFAAFCSNDFSPFVYTLCFLRLLLFKIFAIFVFLVQTALRELLLGLFPVES